MRARERWILVAGLLLLGACGDSTVKSSVPGETTEPGAIQGETVTGGRASLPAPPLTSTPSNSTGTRRRWKPIRS